jgi:hypothetical protein
VLIAALAQDVQEENRPLPEITRILIQSSRGEAADLARKLIEHLG